jgi:hypothetical protein
MPLIDLQTNLRDLKYGDFGVEPPLVTKDINDAPSPNSLAMEVTRRTDDLKRITTLLTTGPGLKHIVNQTALSVVEKSIQSNSAGKTGIGKILSGGWSSAKSIASMIAQVPVNGTGTHFVEGFMGKRGYLPKVQGHRSALNGEVINTKIEGRERQEERGALLTKFDTFGTQTANISITDAGETTSEQAKKSRKQKRQEALDAATSTKAEDLDKEYYASGVGSEPIGFKAVELSQNTRAQGLYTRVAQGFEQISLTPTEVQSPEDKNGDSYTLRPKDRITAKFPKRGSIGIVNGLDTQAIEEKTKEAFKDIIDFNFKVITPQSSQDQVPDVTILPFRAYLDNFNDSYSADWSSFKYLGRAEDFRSYQGFSRSITFGFKVAASSVDELKPLYAKLNLLAGTTAPTYSTNNFMRGNFVAITIGGYLVQEPGVIESVTFDWNTDYTWQTSTYGTNEDGNFERLTDLDRGLEDIPEVPTVLDVSITFSPTHTIAPQFGNKFIGRKNRLAKPEIELDEVVVTTIPEEDEQI